MTFFGRFFYSSLWLVSFLLLTGPSALAQHPQIGDYNGDGLADLSVAQVNRSAGITSWLSRHNIGNDFSFYTFPVPGDALVHGRFFADLNVYTPAVVFVRSAALPLEWHFVKPDGTRVTLSYGSPGMRIPNQMDMDGDGITDLTVIALGTADLPSHATWYTALSASGGSVLAQVFGLASDTLFLTDSDNDKVGEMVALRSSNFTWFIKEFDSQTLSSQTQWGLPNDLIALPYGDPQKGLTHVVFRPSATNLVAYLRREDDSSEIQSLPALPTAIPQVGNFSGEITFAWNQRNAGLAARIEQDDSLSVFPHGTPDNVIITPFGQVIQPTEDGRIGASTTAPPPPPPPPPGPSECTPTQGNELWKPKADSNVGAVILVSSSLVGQPVTVTDSAGTVVASEIRQVCCPNGGREHRFFNKRGDQLSASAPIFVRFGSSRCIRIDNPAVRND